MTVLTEGRHAAEFVLSEAAGHRSRDNITITSGAGIVAAGTVLGKITAGGEYTPSDDGAADGSETAVAINLYEVDATSAAVEVAAITRDAEVNQNILTYHSGRPDAAAKNTAHADLAGVGIIVRNDAV